MARKNHDDYRMKRSPQQEPWFLRISHYSDSEPFYLGIPETGPNICPGASVPAQEEWLEAQLESAGRARRVWSTVWQFNEIEAGESFLKGLRESHELMPCSPTEFYPRCASNFQG